MQKPKIIFPKTTMEEIDSYIEKKKHNVKIFCEEEIKEYEKRTKINVDDIIEKAGFICGILFFLGCVFITIGMETKINGFISAGFVVEGGILVVCVITTITCLIVSNWQKRALERLLDKETEFFGYKVSFYNLDWRWSYFGQPKNINENIYYDLLKNLSKLNCLICKGGDDYRFLEFKSDGKKEYIVFARYLSGGCGPYKISEWTMQMPSRSKDILIECLEKDILDFSFIDDFYRPFLDAKQINKQEKFYEKS